MWGSSITLEYVNFIMWALKKVRIFVYYHTSKLTFGNLGEVILPVLFIGIDIHLGIIH